MDIKVHVDDRVSAQLRELIDGDLPESRRDLVADAMRAALAHVVRLNPVETGRSRAAWTAALEQFGGGSPAGPGGSQGTASAIAEGRRLGSVERVEQESMTEAAASNAVRYVKYLEYGTSKMAAFAMVRRALASVQQQVGRWFRFPRR
jgi:hypothetical protein